MANLKQFLKTGRLGELSLGMLASDVVALLGDADDLSKKSNPLVMVYGNLELTFFKQPDAVRRELVSVVLQYSLPLPEDRTVFAFEDWDPTGSNEAAFREFLDSMSYPPAATVGGKSGRQLVLLSRVVAHFVEDRLHSLRLAKESAEQKANLSVAEDREASLDDIHGMFREAEQVLGTGAIRPAFLIAWAGLEATLRRAVLRAGKNGRIGTKASQLIQDLWTSNRITLQEREFLERVRQDRTIIVHGLAPVEITAETVQRILQLSDQLLTESALPKEVAG